MGANTDSNDGEDITLKEVMDEIAKNPAFYTDGQSTKDNVIYDNMVWSKRKESYLENVLKCGVSYSENTLPALFTNANGNTVNGSQWKKWINQARLNSCFKPMLRPYLDAIAQKIRDNRVHWSLAYWKFANKATIEKLEMKNARIIVENE